VSFAKNVRILVIICWSPTNSCIISNKSTKTSGVGTVFRDTVQSASLCLRPLDPPPPHKALDYSSRRSSVGTLGPLCTACLCSVYFTVIVNVRATEIEMSSDNFLIHCLKLLLVVLSTKPCLALRTKLHRPSLSCNKACRYLSDTQQACLLTYVQS
jgi:hypothetical protein